MANQVRWGRLLAGVLVLGLLLVGAVAGARALLDGRGPQLVLPQRCVASSADLDVTLRLEQAHWTAIVTGVSVARGLPPRAASIAMATVYQETDIRNLDYGDRDSVGLFQQRPSQDWGSVEEIMDPYYSTNAFYDVLVTVPGWESDDINDVAQAVQRSGFPEAYRDHEADGRTLASVFTGQSPAGLSCAFPALQAADPVGLAESLELTLGSLDSTATEAGEDGPATLTVPADSPALAWTIASHAVANADRHGVASVDVADQSWTHDPEALASWDPTETITDGVVVTFAD